MNETRYWLWLSLVFGAGNPRVWQLLDHFDSAHDAFSPCGRERSPG